MNKIEEQLRTMIQETIRSAYALDIEDKDVMIDMPKDNSHGDFSSNIAMRLARPLKQNPHLIAETLSAAFDLAKAGVQAVSIAGPGFINFTINPEILGEVINVVLNDPDHYGESARQDERKFDVEYVSVNPTGDIHPGHARGAAIGDSVTRLMRMAGMEVTREYYMNDAGSQIDNMGRSLQARYSQAFGQDVEMPQDGYFGPDIIDIATTLKADIGDAWLDDDLSKHFLDFREYGLKKEIDKLISDLALFRVEFDVITSERSIRERGLVEVAVEQLKRNGMTYEADGATWLKSTEFGDDKDRVIIRSDGSYTYVTPDIAYHLDKMQRGFDRLVDFLGADHHGYVARLKAAIQALGYDSEALNVQIIQMVRIIKDNEEYKLSKRSGRSVALRDLIEEVGVDPLRYFFVSRSADTQMDLDLDLAIAQSNDNPVYYAQYAHARMCSILIQGQTIALTNHFELLVHEKEIELLKLIADFPSVIADSAKTYQPHKVCLYIQKLASAFHSFYGVCYVVDSAKPELSQQRLSLVKATQITLKNALNSIGVSAPERM